MLDIIGTIKIDTHERQHMFTYNLRSMIPIAHLLRWRLNIAGRHAAWARNEITNRWGDVEITLGDDVSMYHRQRRQMDKLAKDGHVFLWQEDHWFLCPHPSLFLYLLAAYERSGVEVLTVTHLTVSWERKQLLPAVRDTWFFTVRLVNVETQANVWAKHPGSYLVGVPAIYSWQFADYLLEFKREATSRSPVPFFELPEKEARAFLRDRSFREMIPGFHAFREVGFGVHPAACNMGDAIKWLALRDGGDVFGGGNA